MRNVFKKITASVMAIATLSLGMTGISANASSWSLRYASGAPGNVTSQIVGVTSSSSRSSITESCTAFYRSGPTASGEYGNVKYSSYYVKASGGSTTTLYYKVSGQTYSSLVHNEEIDARAIAFTAIVPANSTIYTTYTLQNYSGVTLSASGTNS